MDENSIIEDIDTRLKKEKEDNFDIADIVKERTTQSLKLLRKYGDEKPSKETIARIMRVHRMSIEKEYERLKKWEDSPDSHTS